MPLFVFKLLRQKGGLEALQVGSFQICGTADTKIRSHSDQELMIVENYSGMLFKMTELRRKILELQLTVVCNHTDLNNVINTQKNLPEYTLSNFDKEDSWQK